MPFIKGGKGIVGPNAAVWDQIRAWLHGIEKRSEEYRNKDEEKYQKARIFTRQQYLKSCIYHPKQQGRIDDIFLDLLVCGYIERIGRGVYRLLVPPPLGIRLCEVRDMSYNLRKNLAGNE